MIAPSEPGASALPANWRSLDWAFNIYRCEACAHVVTTVDVDAGTTPFLSSCPKCNGTSRSACYPHVRPLPGWIPEPTQEWYKPTPAEAARFDPGTQQHIAMGGLVRRAWTGKTPIPNPYGPKKKGGA